LPQGLPKKIELQLLLADLALKLLDTLARRRKIAPHRLKVANPKALARPVGRPQRFRPTPPEVLAPFIKMPTRHPKLMAQLRRSLPGHHPLHNRQLELPPVDTSLPSGHRSPRQNCPLLSCLTSGVHSKADACIFVVIYKQMLRRGMDACSEAARCRHRGRASKKQEFTGINNDRSASIRRSDAWSPASLGAAA
jgi:hypothetical protein